MCFIRRRPHQNTPNPARVRGMVEGSGAASAVASSVGSTSTGLGLPRSSPGSAIKGLNSGVDISLSTLAVDSTEICPTSHLRYFETLPERYGNH